ncbi:MAG: replication initiation factor domain-containing protein, partial [Burkholderiaceae bacterium]
PTVFAQGAPAEETPINNMGVTLATATAVDLVMTDTGEVKQVMVRIPAPGQCAVVDWINFTVLEDTWFRTARQHMIDDDQIVGEASRNLEKIFGFGVTAHRDRGLNFYRDSWVLGDDFGFVCFGGQRATMLITLNGHGCANALDGWEKRLHQFLTEVAVRPVISRIDLAHDDFDGAYLSVDWAERQWHEGGYTATSGGVPPSIERIGNWHRPSGKGRTLTIGRRTSGKFVRFYEKGRKEGDKLSDWCRCEVEFKSSDRVIPFDVLLSPSDYFAATYPCFAQFVSQAQPQRIAVKQKTAQIVVDACVEVTRHQFGKYLRVFRDLYGDKATLDMVCHPDKNAWPRRMKPLTDSATSKPSMVFQTRPIPSFIDFCKSVTYMGLNADNGFPKAKFNSMEHST